MSFARSVREIIRSKAFLVTCTGVLVFLTAIMAMPKISFGQLEKMTERFFSSKELPSCKSATVQDELRQELSSNLKFADKLSEFATGQNLLSLSFRRSKEVGVNASGDRRFCEADVETSIGSASVAYSVEWYDKSDPTISGGIKINIMDKSVLNTSD